MMHEPHTSAEMTLAAAILRKYPGFERVAFGQNEQIFLIRGSHATRYILPPDWQEQVKVVGDNVSLLLKLRAPKRRRR